MGTPEMRITALAPWFGGKRTLAPRIVEALGPHRTYFEPFCGSMAVLLAKPRALREMVNDLHGDLINLAMVVRHERMGPQLYRRLRRTLFCEQMSAAATENLELYAPVGRYDIAMQGPSLERAYWYFIASWMGRNGFAGTVGGEGGFAKRFTATGGDPVVRFHAAVNSIGAWRQRLAAVTITSGDGFEMLERQIPDADGIAVYVDPPYVEKSASYVFDFGADDHERLRAALARFRRTRVVVSYYDCARVREMYAGWRFICCTMAKASGHGGSRGEKGTGTSPEVLIVNGGEELAWERSMGNGQWGVGNGPDPDPLPTDHCPLPVGASRGEGSEE